jgi:hypothetical protein
MFDRLRLVPAPSALALLLILASSAHAGATVDLEPLASVPSGIGIRNADIYVAQPGAKRVTDFRPDTGQRVRELPLPGAAGAATGVSLGPWGLWVGIGSGADRGFARIDDSDAPLAVKAVSTATAFGCGPTSLANDPAHSRLFYAATQPAGAPACGTHGLGAITPDGTITIADTTFGDVSDLMVAGGKLLLLDHDTNQLRRLSADDHAFTQEAAIALPTGSDPSGLTLGADGQVWITLRATGQVVEVPADAASGTQPKVLADGLQQPSAIAGNTYGGGVAGGSTTWVASSGDATLVRFRPGGGRKVIALPAGVVAGDLVAQGRDVWVLDTAGAQVAHVIDGVQPLIAGQVDMSGTTASLDVDPAGSDTKVTFVVDGRWPDSSVRTFDGGTVANGRPQTVTASLATLLPGDYYIYAQATNEDGHSEAIIHRPYTVAGPPAPPKVIPPPTKPKAKAPTLADLITPAATRRCVATRTLRLGLRARKSGQVTVATLRLTVGKAKARTYTAKQLKKGLTLKGLPRRGAYKLKITLTLSDKTRLTTTRTYRACAAKHS